MDLQQELEALRAENAALKAPKSSKPVTFKVGEKGGVSIYGLGRFPVTLYREQWEKLLEAADAIRKFMADNEITTDELLKGLFAQDLKRPTEAQVQDALDLVAEGARVRFPCDCLDCRTLRVLAAEVRWLQASSKP